ncbi:MAG: peptidylprolyl isomerase [Bacteroidota bacterium]
MKNLLFIFIFSCCIGCLSMFGQTQNDAVLLTIGNDKITVGEFLNVYRKNNNKESIVDKKALDEYLDLYTLFRLKVKEAKEIGVDTTKAFLEELKGYRKTLAQPYLIEKNAVDNLVKEVYDRIQWDLRTSHILIKINPEALSQDTSDAYMRIIMIRDFLQGKTNLSAFKKYETSLKASMKISKNSSHQDSLNYSNKINPLKKMFAMKGHDFSSVAKEISDHSSKVSGGDLGYFIALSGTGYPYEYESAAYKSKAGEIVGPIRTSLGYHLILVTDKKPHQEIHISHIMLMFKKEMTKDDSLKLKSRIDSIALQLKNGKDFAELAKKISEHKETAKKGGDMGWMSRTSNFPVEFKDAGFNLKDNGSISAPINSRFGWHIIRRTAIKGVAPFDSLKFDLKNKVQKDVRISIAKDAMIIKLKAKYNFKEDINARNEFYKSIDSTIMTGKWKADKVSNLNKQMFSLLTQTFSQQDFAKFIEKTQHAGEKKDIQHLVNFFYKQFVDETCMNIYDSRLEIEYPEFKAVMNEYRDGILLFNLSDQEVWSKAIKDTTGAKEFYEKNKENFMWEERVDVTMYYCADEKIAEKVKKMIGQKKTEKDILNALNKDTVINVSIENKLLLKGDNAMIDETAWALGFTPNKPLKDKIFFADIHKIIKPTPKTYQESRGLVTNKYQLWLEKNWIDLLKKKYPVTVNRKILDSIQPK